MKQLHVEQLAQIWKADVEFGDLTLLVGPQASGKSVFLQLFKLVKDHGPITKTLKRYGYSYEPGVTESPSDPLLTLMFGEGMGAIWRQESRVKADGKLVDLSALRKGNGKDQESVLQEKIDPRALGAALRHFLTPEIVIKSRPVALV